MAVRIRLILAVLCAFVFDGNARGGEPIEELMSATFRIADRDHSGTCFIVAPKTVDPENPRRVVLATAAHVFDDMAGRKCDLILRTETGDQQYSRRVVPITIRSGDQPQWTRHPEMDVATMAVDLPEGVAVKPIPFDHLADTAFVTNRAVKVGSETWIPCFPAKLEANESGWPVLRRGSVASHPLKAAKTIMIDYRAFGGDSGAPVAVIVNDEPFVFGVVLGMHRQTDRSTLPFEERTMHTPLGLSFVAQSVYLRETIELMATE